MMRRSTNETMEERHAPASLSEPCRLQINLQAARIMQLLHNLNEHACRHIWRAYDGAESSPAASG